MWGGRFNPVIPIDDLEQAKNLVELFRLDFVLPIGASEEVQAFPARFPHLKNPLFPASLFVNGMAGSKHARILDIKNTLVALGDSAELKAIKDQGFRLYSWAPDDPLADVFLATFGAYPEAATIGIDYREVVSSVFDGADTRLEPQAPIRADALEHPAAGYLSRHRLTRHYSTRAGWDFPGFYVGDAADFDDLAAYWNIRAADIPVIFIDRNHVARFAELIPAWERTAQELVARRPNFQQRLAMWTRNQNPEADLQIFGGRINSICQIHNHSWQGGGINPPMMYLGDAQVLGSISGSENRPRVTFKLDDKPFSGDRWFYQQHLVASLAFGVGLGDDHFTLEPPYVPELNEAFSRAMHVDYRKLRVEPERVGLVIDAADSDGFITALPVAELFEHIFDLAGFSAKPSNGGLIARQLITHLGGLQGARVFKIPGVRRLLKTYGPRDVFTRHGAVQLIGGKDPENPGAKFDDHQSLYIEPRPIGTKLSPPDVFAYLVEKGLFRIGAELKCPACRLATWTPIDTLKQSMVCELCGSAYDATRQLLAEKWSYRRSGVLGVERNTQGAVPVALTLQQLDANGIPLNDRLYMPSLDLTPRDGTDPVEIDLVWMTSRAPRELPAIILGECKDRHKGIDRDDIENLRRVAEALPRHRFRPYFLLVKLGSFTADEIALARTLNTEYEYRVIMLTARELEPYHFFERTKQEFPHIDEYGASPEDLARVTAQIYFQPPAAAPGAP